MLLYLFTFLAGIATVLSPCILPVLPAILSASAEKGRFRPLGIVLGLVVSFAFFILSLTYLVHQFGISANALRYAAIMVIGLFGLVMLFPTLGEKFASLTSKFVPSHKTRGTIKKSSFWPGVFLGAALGLVWTPCAGPILAVVTTLVGTQNVTWKVVLLTLTYSFGSALPLLLIAYGGQRALALIPFLSRHAEKIKRALGALMILTAIALYYNLEIYLQEASINYIPGLQIENSSLLKPELDKLRPASPYTDQKIDALKKEQGSSLPKINPAPNLVGIHDWINSNPLSLADLKGKVVLLDFWTYSCINCVRTLPLINKWYDTYKDDGLEILGIHTPEFEFEKNLDNVGLAVKRFNITYPVALDNDYMTWQAYNNVQWPAHYLLDQEGIIRQVHYGEGKYLETENAIRCLLGKPPLDGLDYPIQKQRSLTPEIYLGIQRGTHYSPYMILKPDQSTPYTFKSPLETDEVGLTGLWKIEDERIISQENANTLDLNFLAKRVYLVMEAPRPTPVTVYLNGVPLASQFYTADMNRQGQIMVHEPRKYNVINLKSDTRRHQITLRTPEGISAYTFTFGDDP